MAYTRNGHVRKVRREVQRSLGEPANDDYWRPRVLLAGEHMRRLWHVPVSEVAEMTAAFEKLEADGISDLDERWLGPIQKYLGISRADQEMIVGNGDGLPLWRETITHIRNIQTLNTGWNAEYLSALRKARRRRGLPEIGVEGEAEHAKYRKE